jgi:general secretion pathway protein G
MTLIEIMLVVVIMSMLAAGVGIAVIKAKERADLNLARSAVSSLAGVAEAFQMTNGSSADCPTLGDLQASKLLRRGTNTDDPWGTPYEILCDGGEVDVRSAGPDRERGTADDIGLGQRPSEE